MFLRWVILGVPLALLAFSLGCSTEPEQPPRKKPVILGPAETVNRLIQVYEQKNTTEYAKLFTGDFLFEFSQATDPDLANEYASGWSCEDETIAALHLFQGGVNSNGEFMPAAQTIDLDLIQKVPLDDNSGIRDPAKYKVLFTPVTLTVQLPPSQEDPEGRTIVVGGADPAVHRFFLVRGDAADSLAANQPADSSHWYCYRWRDESSSLQAPGEYREVESTTWGRVKGDWR
jgi:hypothetical protein